MAEDETKRRPRLRFDASDFLIDQATKLGNLLGVSPSAAARMACAEGLASMLARVGAQPSTVGAQPTVGAPDGSPGDQAGPPCIHSSSSGIHQDEDRRPSGAPTFPKRSRRGVPSLDTKDANGWNGHHVERVAPACKKNPAHGRLTVRWNAKDRLWFAGCPTFAETECSDTWNPGREQRDEFPGDKEQARKEAALRERPRANPYAYPGSINTLPAPVGADMGALTKGMSVSA